MQAGFAGAATLAIIVTSIAIGMWWEHTMANRGAGTSSTTNTLGSRKGS